MVQTSPQSRPAHPDALPLLYRMAAHARRTMRGPGTRLIYRSSIAHPLRRLLSAGAPQGPRIVEMCGGANAGMRMLIDLASEKYYWLGTHEEHAQSFAASAVKPGHVVYDVGAHIGFFSLLFARHVGPSGRVYAFEPVPANWSRLCVNVSANALTNVDVRRVAISDVAGKVAFASGRTSLQGRISGTHEASAITVPATTIDDLVRDGCAPPDFIKIDVEGAEARVLRGAAETISTYRPRMLIEVHSDDAGADVASILTPTYTFHALGRGDEVTPPLAPGHYDARPR